MKPETHNLNPLLDRVEAIARDAGAAIMAIYGGGFHVESKDDQSPLTEADTAANRLITQALNDLAPGIPVLSEEAVEDFHGPNEQGRYWLVDPLDGTKEFIKRNGEFTVNIALIEQGRPMLGVVHAPAMNLLYAAAAGVGAYKVDARGERTSIRVAAHAEGTPWRVVGSRSHAGDSLKDFLDRLGQYELVPMGSSLKFCLVAEGAADLYPRFGPTSLWDTAAAQCVVEQAGGRVLDLESKSLGYGNPEIRLNPHFIVYGGSKGK